jgi:hypothetical protein
MKVTVKKNLIIFHKPQEWETVMTGLVQEYGPKIGISWVMRRELGFVVRNYRALVPNDYKPKPGRPDMHYEDHVCLDFYNESTQSWFVLRYLNLNENSQDLR